MLDTSMPPNPSLLFHNNKIITYSSRGSMPKSSVKNEEGLLCLNRNLAKRGGTHLLKDALAPSELASGG